MTAITTSARAAVITALDTALTCTVYPMAPKVPIPPSVAVTYDSPWLIPATIGGRLRAQVNLRVMVVTLDNNDMATHETLVEAALVALPDYVTVVDVAAPASMDIGPQGSVMVSEIRFHIHVKEN